MGTGKDFISSILADKLIPFMRRPVEDIIYETLDRRQTPSRKDFHELRDQLNTVKGKITNATSGIRKLGEQVESLDDTVSEFQNQDDVGGTTSPQFQSIEESVAALKATVSVLNEKLSHQSTVIAEQAAQISALSAQPSAATPVLTQPTTCKVPGCGLDIRARGFCRAHYAKWSRGTLDGFVGKDGVVNGVKLDKQHIAEAFTINGTDIIVGGNSVGVIQES